MPVERVPVAPKGAFSRTALTMVQVERDRLVQGHRAGEVGRGGRETFFAATRASLSETSGYRARVVRFRLAPDMTTQLLAPPLLTRMPKPLRVLSQYVVCPDIGGLIARIDTSVSAAVGTLGSS